MMAGTVFSSGSHEIQHWALNSWLGGRVIFRVKRPIDSYLASMRSSQALIQPPLDSSTISFRSGNLSNVPYWNRVVKAAWTARDDMTVKYQLWPRMPSK